VAFVLCFGTGIFAVTAAVQKSSLAFDLGIMPSTMLPCASPTPSAAPSPTATPSVQPTISPSATPLTAADFGPGGTPSPSSTPCPTPSPTKTPCPSGTQAQADQGPLNANSTPLPTPPPCPSPSPTNACRAAGCSSVTVTCDTTICGNSPACASTNSCDMYVSPGLCKQMGLKDGGSYPPSDIISAGNNGDPLTAGQAVNFCAASHEATHMEDPGCISNCQTEQNAYSASSQCMQGYFSQYCTHPGQVFGWGPAECDALQKQISYAQSALGFSQCLCSTGSTCDSCEAECRTGGASNSSCESLGNSYCPRNGK
jgi:hypothetical protein